MSEIEGHTLAWMGKIDAKLDSLGERLDQIDVQLAQLRDEQLVTSSICLRLAAREVESRGLFALYQRLKAGQERLGGRVMALEDGATR